MELDLKKKIAHCISTDYGVQLNMANYKHKSIYIWTFKITEILKLLQMTDSNEF